MFPPTPVIFNWLWYSDLFSEYHSQFNMYGKGGKHVVIHILLHISFV